MGQEPGDHAFCPVPSHPQRYLPPLPLSSPHLLLGHLLLECRLALVAQLVCALALLVRAAVLFRLRDTCHISISISIRLTGVQGGYEGG